MFLCSVISVYEAHQKLLNELGGAKRAAENGYVKNLLQCPPFGVSFCFFSALLQAVSQS